MQEQNERRIKCSLVKGKRVDQIGNKPIAIVINRTQINIDFKLVCV